VPIEEEEKKKRPYKRASGFRISTYAPVMDVRLFLGVKVKVRLKFTLEQATKTQRGSRGIALFFL
jgi:hypothetical protein